MVCFKRIFLSLFTSLVVLGGVACADSTLPLPSLDSYDRVITDNTIAQAVHSGSPVNTVQAIRSFFRGEGNNMLLVMNIVLGTVAIIYLVILGFRMVMAQGNEEQMSGHKKQFGWIIVGLATISVAEFFAYSAFDPVYDITADTQTAAFKSKVLQLVRFGQYIVVGLAFLVGSLSAYNLITGTTGGDDEVIQEEKKVLLSFLFGFGYILFARVIVERIFFVDDGTRADASTGVKEIIGVINYGLGYVIAAAAMMLVLASLYYVTSLGSETQANRAKSLIMACIIGLILAISAFVLGRFFLYIIQGFDPASVGIPT